MPADPATRHLSEAAATLSAALAPGDGTLEEELRSRARAIRGTDHRLALFGAGTIGRSMLAGLRAAGVEPVAFADDTIEKQGTSVDGVPVASPEAVAAQWGERLTLAVTMISSASSFMAARQRLAALIDGPVISAFELARCFPDQLLPLGPVDVPGSLSTERQRILAAASLFSSDPDSASQFAAHIRFRRELDFAVLPRPTAPAYFPPEVEAALPASLCFVDCGAYDGDTLRELLSRRPSKVARIVAFEPDGANFARLVEYVESLPQHLSGRIETRQQAVGERSERIMFDATGNMAAAASSTGSATVDSIALDAVIDPSQSPVYIKFDIEGAELGALRGAARLLRDAAPVLAVSAYHHPQDLWEIPLLLKQLAPEYRFLLRTHGEDGMEVVCYALPLWLGGGALA